MVLAEGALMALAEGWPEDDRDRFRHTGYAVSLGLPLPPTTFD
jgi:hypothetical protein